MARAGNDSVGFGGATAGLELLEVRLLRRLNPGALGYLLFGHRGGMAALKGIATGDASEESELSFVVIDRAQLPELRHARTGTP